MRTTVTLDPDAEQIVRRRMRERRISFKQALNEAIRDSATHQHGEAPYRTTTAAMGEPPISLDRALQLAAQLEDDESVRRMRSGT